MNAVEVTEPASLDLSGLSEDECLTLADGLAKAKGLSGWEEIALRRMEVTVLDMALKRVLTKRRVEGERNAERWEALSKVRADLRARKTDAYARMAEAVAKDKAAKGIAQ